MPKPPASRARLALALLSFAALAPVGAAAQAPAAVAASAPAAWAEGEVRRVDAASGQLTLRHGEIRNLDMPPMTMVFEARDKAWLQGLKAGDRVRFQAIDAQGRLVLTAIEKAP